MGQFSVFPSLPAVLNTFTTHSRKAFSFWLLVQPCRQGLTVSSSPTLQVAVPAVCPLTTRIPLAASVSLCADSIQCPSPACILPELDCTSSTAPWMASRHFKLPQTHLSQSSHHNKWQFYLPRCLGHTPLESSLMPVSHTCIQFAGKFHWLCLVTLCDSLAPTPRLLFSSKSQNLGQAW